MAAGPAAIAALNGLLFRIKSIVWQILVATAVILLALAGNFFLFKLGFDLGLLAVSCWVWY